MRHGRMTSSATAVCRMTDTEQEVARINKAKDAEFDQAIEQTVEEAICRMPERKRVQLKKEVLEYGTDLHVTRPEVVV